MNDQLSDDFHARVRAQANSWQAEIEALHQAAQRAVWLVTWLVPDADSPFQVEHCANRAMLDTTVATAFRQGAPRVMIMPRSYRWPEHVLQHILMVDTGSR